MDKEIFPESKLKEWLLESQKIYPTTLSDSEWVKTQMNIKRQSFIEGCKYAYSDRIKQVDNSGYWNQKSS